MEIRYTKYKHELLLSYTQKTENTKFIKKIRTLTYTSTCLYCVRGMLSILPICNRINDYIDNILYNITLILHI